ncbi:MAG TPA: TIGR03000 domain-containing protein, partial [Lacipirellulaceae bacterium]
CGGEGGATTTYYGGGYDGGYAQSTRFVPAGTYAATVTPAKTKLTLHVPAEAKVTLAGVSTKQAGEVREFSTDRLSAGQAWQNYTVHVEVVRDGKTVAQDKQITLTGGAQQELSFDFGGEQVAQL